MARAWAVILMTAAVAASALAGMALLPGEDAKDDCTEEWLQEDDGTAEGTAANTYGFLPLVKCMEPAGYPSYLYELSGYMTANTVPGPVKWIVFTAPNSSSAPQTEVYRSNEFTPVKDDWNHKDVSSLSEFSTPINSGVWCFGIIYQAAATVTKIGTDMSGADGHDWIKNASDDWKNMQNDLAFAANLMFRAKAGDCAPDNTTTPTTTTTTIPGDDDSTDDDSGDDDSGDDDSGDDDSGDDTGGVGDDDIWGDDDDDDDDDDSQFTSGGRSGDDADGGCCG